MGRIRRYRHALPLLVASMALHCPGGAVAFMSRSQSGSLTRKVKVAPLFGTMLRQSLLKKASGQKRKGPTPKDGGVNDNSRSMPVISVDFLIGVTREALFRQRRILEALQKQDDKQEEQKANDSVKKRRIQIQENMAKIKEIQKEIKNLHQSTVDVDFDTLQAIKDKLIELGFRSLLSQGPDGWKHVQELRRSSKAEFGRPADFNGLVFKSPLGVPILVGRKGGHHDEVLRRISQGNDLWFQVEDYSGSRVLLRTSLATCRGLKNSKSCRQAAADIAAYFSDYRQRFDSVPIMYTDSKRVAKRGSKIGQMRKRKSLGTIYGYPGNVFDMCKGKEPT